MSNYFVKHCSATALGIGFFLFMFTFFSLIHPVYPYDLDDWKIMLRVRDLYPSIYEWNPTRVLPEFLMPRCGELAMYVVYPLIGDISKSICYVTAFFLASMISVYMLFFNRMLRKNFSLPTGTRAMLTLLFFVFHFLLFRKYDSENQHLFYSYDLTDHYFYTIPNLLGSILVIIFITDKPESPTLKRGIIKKAIFAIALYLMVFSNLFNSIILSAFLGSYLLFYIGYSLSQKIAFFKTLKRYSIHIFTVVLWLIAVAFEPFGGNADEIGTRSLPFISALGISVRNMKSILMDQTNILAVSLILIPIILFLIYAIKEKKSFKTFLPLIVFACSTLVSAIFLTLLGALSFPYYILRIMSIYAVPFFLILTGFYCMASLIKWCPIANVILPFILLLTICNTEQRGKTFQDVQTFLINNDQQFKYQIIPRDILLQNNQNIQKIIKSDQMGQDSITLIVPPFNQDGNWPLSWGYGKSLSRFLLRYNLISKEIHVTVVRDTHPEQQRFIR